ncbi:MAG: rhodanese-like domain-containing protein [Ilumatobacteraceae bacterium]
MTRPSRIDAALEAARARLHRVAPDDLATEVASGALVVDIRPEQDRQADGVLPGAIVIERNVLEWRLDPTSGHHLDDASPDRRVILVCNEGYASSLAAVALVDLGVAGATDLAGGFRAWRRTRSDGTPTNDGA